MSGAAEDAIARERINGLRDLFQAEIQRLDKQHGDQVHAVQLVRTADYREREAFKSNVEERFTSVNDFRKSLADLGSEMATRREMQSFEDATATRHEDLQKQLSELRSRLDRGPAELAQLAHQQALQTGRQQGVQTVATNAYYLFAIAAVIGGLLGHFIK